MRPKVQLLAHDLKFQRQERGKLNQMRRQVLIPREKIPSLSSSNLQPLFYFHPRILHNKRVIIRLLFQATKVHHISLSFPKRICYSKTTPFGLEKGIYFLFFYFTLLHLLPFRSTPPLLLLPSTPLPYFYQLSLLVKDCQTPTKDCCTIIEDHCCCCCHHTKIRFLGCLFAELYR